MSARKPPLLMRSGLTGRVYIVTAYKVLYPSGRIMVNTKHDVTDQYEALLAADLGFPDPAEVHRNYPPKAPS